MAGDVQGDPGGWWDTIRVYVFGGGAAASVGMLGGGFRWLLDRRDRVDGARAKQIEAEAAAEARERERQDKVDADQIARLTAEIVRKDQQIAELSKGQSDREAALKSDRNAGWDGLRRTGKLYDKMIHDARHNEQTLCLIIERAGVALPTLRPLLDLPDIETLAGRTKA